MKKKDPTSHRIIEKRRRDRMNNCLADLSRLIPSHYMRKGRGRVEKTEIIEMAIRHLKDLRESSARVQPADNQRHEPEPSLGTFCAQTEVCDAEEGDGEAVIVGPVSGGGTIVRAPSLQPINTVTTTSDETPLDCTSNCLQQLAPLSTRGAQQVPLAMMGGAHQLAQAAPSLGLSMKAFQHQQYRNNENQIHSRASEQANRYRGGDCCSCRGRTQQAAGATPAPIASRNDTAAPGAAGKMGGNSHNNNNNNSSSSSNNNNGSSSDQSDTGSLDYPSSSSGSNKDSQQSGASKSASDSSSGEGSPTSSTGSSSSFLSSAPSSSSSSAGWYKKAWLIRSSSRTLPKN